MQEPAAAAMNEELHRDLRFRYGNAIRLERMRANMTQAEFAEEVGVSLSGLQHWEWGRKLPRPEIRRRLERFYPRLAGVWDRLGLEELEEEGTDGPTDGRTRPGPTGSSTPP